MRALALLAALASCSSKAPPPTASSIDELVSPDAVGVFKQTPEMFFVLSYAKPLLAPQACWDDLVGKLQAAYQISVPGPDAYFVVTGDLPREDVLKCVPATFTIGPKVKDDGDVVTFETSMGNVWAAWRGRFVVFGSERLVKAALVPSPDTAARWRGLNTPLASSPMWMSRIDNVYSMLIGNSSTDTSFVVDKLEVKPKRPFMAGRFIVHYTSPTTAQEGAAYIRKWSGDGKWPVEIPNNAGLVTILDQLAAGVGKMKLTQTGSTVEIAFDSDQFGGAEALAAAIQAAGNALGK